MGLTQAEMFERLGDTGTRLYVGHIDDYEKDRRVPPLQVVLAYARVAGITMEQIADDNLDLPKKLKMS
jgi:transcriptional regulator with XRE-family HTH domain